MIASDHFLLLALALALDAILGDPDHLWRRIPHPVALIGMAVAFLDRLLNDRRFSPLTRRVLGGIALFIVVELSAMAGYGLMLLFAGIPHGWIGTVLVAAVMLAGRSLYDHVAAVRRAFDGGIVPAREAVARIVGRDTAMLDESRICRSAIESTAENFSDGVVAPALWFLLLGLPGLFAYKAINTADSMIGHLTEKHRDFGWAAARVDDLVNLPASRIAALAVALAAPLAGGSVFDALKASMADAAKHRSPNAGWPEAAMASALGLALAGPRHYGGIMVSDPFLNERGRREAAPADIDRALRVYLGANAALVVLVAAFAGAVALLA